MTKQQIIHINVPISIVITAQTKADAFGILDTLKKEEILKLALSQLPFEETQTSMRLQWIYLNTQAILQSMSKRESKIEAFLIKLLNPYEDGCIDIVFVFHI